MDTRKHNRSNPPADAGDDAINRGGYPDPLKQDREREAKIQSALAAASQSNPDILFNQLPEGEAPKPAKSQPHAGPRRAAAASTPAQPELPLPPAPAPALTKVPGGGQNRVFLGPFLWGWLVGIVLAGAAAGAWLWLGPQRRELNRLQAGVDEQVRKLQAELELARQDANGLRAGNRQLTGLLNAFSTDWDRPPDKPRYRKAANGIILFWEDGMIWRKYFVLQGKGERGRLVRLNRRPLKAGFFYLENPVPGEWRFCLTALNKEGKETPPGESLVLHFPLE